MSYLCEYLEYFASKTYLPYFPFVKYCVLGCLVRTLLFGFNNSITFRYQNAERVNR